MRDEERELLEPWRDAAAALLGAAPEFTPFESVVLPGEPLYRVSYGAMKATDVLGQTGHFAQTAALRDHVRSLGFEWDDAGWIRAAPTPATFNALLPKIAGEGVGYRVSLQAEDALTASLGPWLALYASGEILVHVCHRAFYEREKIAQAKRLEWQVTTVIHDLTVHALNYHLIPRKTALAIGDRIRTALPERAPEWEKPGATAPLTLATFFDNDLNRYCYAVWSACSAPSDFAPRFETNLGQLWHALDVRIEETRAGKGDVPSGNARDLPPLTPTEFVVRRPDERRR